MLIKLVGPQFSTPKAVGVYCRGCKKPLKRGNPEVQICPKCLKSGKK